MSGFEPPTFTLEMELSRTESDFIPPSMCQKDMSIPLCVMEVSTLWVLRVVL